MSARFGRERCRNSCDAVRLSEPFPEDLGHRTNRRERIGVFQLIRRQQHDVAVLSGADELGRRTRRDLGDEQFLWLVDRIGAERAEGLGAEHARLRADDDLRVVATAVELDMPLITKDVAITESNLIEVYW